MAVCRRFAGGNGDLRQRQIGAGDGDSGARGDRNGVAGLPGHRLLKRPQVGGRRKHLQRGLRRGLAMHLQRAADCRIEAAAGQLAVDANVAVQRPIRGQRCAAGKLVDAEQPIDAEQRRQHRAVVGIKPAIEMQVRCARPRQLAVRIAIEREPHQAQLAR